MKALIVEDEMMARVRLGKTLEKNFTDVEVVGMTGSVAETVAWLSANPAPDVIFMDVELTDGECFEIFRQTDVRSKVVMTTAYDSYAVKAFEAGSIDYLLKPIGLEALSRAVSRCRERQADDSAAILKALAAGSLSASSRRPADEKTEYKRRWLVRVGDMITPVEVGDIAYLYSEDKSNFMVLSDGRRLLVDSALDAFEHQLDPDRFFRISRGCIMSRSAIRSVVKWFSGRLKLSVEPDTPSLELLVSRSRVEDFLAWLE